MATPAVERFADETDVNTVSALAMAGQDGSGAVEVHFGPLTSETPVDLGVLKVGAATESNL